MVVDTLCPCGSKQLDIEAQEVPGGAGMYKINNFNEMDVKWKINKLSGACGTRRQAREKLPRKRPPKCINYHPEEIEIQQCGTATTAYRVSIYSTLTASLFMWAIAMYA